MIKTSQKWFVNFDGDNLKHLIKNHFMKNVINDRPCFVPQQLIFQSSSFFPWIQHSCKLYMTIKTENNFHSWHKKNYWKMFLESHTKTFLQTYSRFKPFPQKNMGYEPCVRPHLYQTEKKNTYICFSSRPFYSALSDIFLLQTTCVKYPIYFYVERWKVEL